MMEEIVERPWGTWQVTAKGFDENGYEWKHKILTVLPDQKLSYQKHSLRDETWVILAGKGTLIIDMLNNDRYLYSILSQDTFHIGKGCAHQVKNEGTTPLIISEIQYGIQCSEEDIVRLPEEEGLI